MSRAFVKEDESGKDDAQVNLPTEPFFATPSGITHWRERLVELERLNAGLKGDLSPERNLEAGRVSREIALLTARLQLAKQSSAPPSDRVGFGSQVVLEDDDGQTWTFHVVGSEEADPTSGAISCYSPLGKELMGKSVDDTVLWKRQGKTISLTIVTI